MQQSLVDEQETLLFEELSDEQCNKLVGGTGKDIYKNGTVDGLVDLPVGDDLVDGKALDRTLEKTADQIIDIPGIDV